MNLNQHAEPEVPKDEVEEGVIIIRPRAFELVRDFFVLNARPEEQNAYAIYRNKKSLEGDFADVMHADLEYWRFVDDLEKAGEIPSFEERAAMAEAICGSTQGEALARLFPLYNEWAASRTKPEEE